MSRKYRQQGYQDSDRDRDRERGPRVRPPAPARSTLTPEERAQRRGLRHALDREANEVVRCHVCGRSIEDFGVIAADSVCPHCNAELHCCRACQHFDSGARWQCKAEIEQPVADKAKRNTCGKFAPRMVLDATGRRAPRRGTGRSNDPKAAFENLFKR